MSKFTLNSKQPKCQAGVVQCLSPTFRPVCYFEKQREMTHSRVVLHVQAELPISYILTPRAEIFVLEEGGVGQKGQLKRFLHWRYAILKRKTQQLTRCPGVLLWWPVQSSNTSVYFPKKRCPLSEGDLCAPSRAKFKA